MEPRLTIPTSHTFTLIVVRLRDVLSDKTTDPSLLLDGAMAVKRQDFACHGGYMFDGKNKGGKSLVLEFRRLIYSFETCSDTI